MAETPLQDPALAPDASEAPDYIAHPFLDPEIYERDPTVLRHFNRLFRDHLETDWHYAQLLNRLLHPVGEEHPLAVNERVLASYLADASTYVRELLQMLPPSARKGFLPDEEVERCNNLRALSSLLMEPGTASPTERRIRQFEAQRKLYLTKLLLQIQTVRKIQDGPRHRVYLNRLLDNEIWSYVRETRDWDARYLRDANGVGVVADANGDGNDSESWRFHVRRVTRELAGGRYDIEIFHHDTRFKRETAGYSYAPGREHYEVQERSRYEQMTRSRSASILSKMLRKGINDPSLISDMLGMKFIVAEEEHVQQLVELLHQVLGGPFLFRNQVDLFRRPEDHEQLNRFSAPGFKVFKEDVDLLYPASETHRSGTYSFSVELQIFTLEGFLRTLHSDDYANHRVYKLRQFLRGVMPYVFPAQLYGRPDLSDVLVPT